MNSFSQILELTNKRGGSSCYIGDPFSQCQRLLYKWLVESNSYILNILKIFPFIYGHVTCHVIKNFNEGNFRIYFVWLKVLVFLLAYFGEFCYMNSSYSRKYITSMFHAFVACKTQHQMFLFFSGHHVGAHPNQGTNMAFPSKSLLINSGKFFHRITKYCIHLNLGEGLCIFTSFHFPDSGLSIERFWCLFWSTLNGVTLKTSSAIKEWVGLAPVIYETCLIL